MKWHRDSRNTRFKHEFVPSMPARQHWNVDINASPNSRNRPGAPKYFTLSSYSSTKASNSSLPGCSIVFLELYPSVRSASCNLSNYLTGMIKQLRYMWHNMSRQRAINMVRWIDVIFGIQTKTQITVTEEIPMFTIDRRSFLGASAILLPSLLLTSESVVGRNADNETPDSVFYNGNVLTVDPGFRAKVSTQLFLWGRAVILGRILRGWFEVGWFGKGQS